MKARHLTRICLLLVATAIPAARAEVGAAGQVALPSAQTAVFTNPAGLGLLGSGGLTLQSGGEDEFYDPLFRAGMLYGNSILGLAGGVSYQARPANRPNEISAFFGVGLRIESVSFGLSGKSGIKDTTDAGFDLGMLYQPEAFSLGITAKGIEEGPAEFGLGFGIELTGGIWAVLDTAVDGRSGSPDAKPGMRFGNELVSLTASWGSGNCRQFSKGVSFGAQVSAAELVTIEGQYEGGPFPKFYGAVTLGL